MKPPDQTTGIIMGHPCGQPLHDLVHRTPAISPTPRTDAAWSKTLWDELNQFWSGNAANKMRDECARLERELTAERDQLRAEVERLKEQLRIESAASAHALHWAEKAEAALAEAKVERETVAQSSLRSLEAYIDKLKQFAERAEKAEAQLHALRLVCGTTDADRFTTWLNVEIAKRENAEAECLEQARLLGMSAEREADLLGKLGRLERELAAMKGTP
jgi:chromosome segregation ATPase